MKKITIILMMIMINILGVKTTNAQSYQINKQIEKIKKINKNLENKKINTLKKEINKILENNQTNENSIKYLIFLNKLLSDEEIEVEIKEELTEITMEIIKNIENNEFIDDDDYIDYDRVYIDEVMENF